MASIRDLCNDHDTEMEHVPQPPPTEAPARRPSLCFPSEPPPSSPSLPQAHHGHHRGPPVEHPLSPSPLHPTKSSSSSSSRLYRPPHDHFSSHHHSDQYMHHHTHHQQHHSEYEPYEYGHHHPLPRNSHPMYPEGRSSFSTSTYHPPPAQPSTNHRLRHPREEGYPREQAPPSRTRSPPGVSNEKRRAFNLHAQAGSSSSAHTHAHQNQRPSRAKEPVKATALAAWEKSPHGLHSSSPAKIKIVQQPLHARMCGFGEKDRRPVDPPPIVQLIVEDDPHYNEFKAPPKSIRLIKPKKKRSKRLGVKKVRQPSKKAIAAAAHAEVESATAIASMIGAKIKTEGCEGGSNNSHESGDEGYKEEHDGDEQQELDELDDEHGNSDNDELSTTGAAAVQRRTSQSGKQTRSRSPSTAPSESKRGSLKNEESHDDNKMPAPQPQLRSQTRLRPDRQGQPTRATFAKNTLQNVKKHTRSGEELPRGMARVVTSGVSAPIPAEIEEDNSDSEQEWPRYEGGREALRQDPLYVLHVSLWSEDGTEVRSMITTPGKTEPPKLTRILMGTLVVSPILLNNEHGEPGWYFTFPDLSIRTEGVYTLKFSMMRFSSFDFSDPEGSQISNIVAEEVSQPFTVYSAKKFPGMTESTELSKAFAKQGLKIPVRNDIRIRKIADKD